MLTKLSTCPALGEFETCKALYNLILEGYLKVASRRDTRVISRGKPGGRNRSFSISRMMIQIAMYAILIGLFLVLYQVFELNPLSLFQESVTQRFRDPVVRELLDRSQIQRIQTALEVYRMEQGQYPKRLTDLVAGRFAHPGRFDVSLASVPSLSYRPGRLLPSEAF